MKRILILTVGALCFFLFAGTSSAQSLSNQPDPIQYLVAPEVPEPGGLINIEIQGIGTFLGDATITWQVDGKVVLSGLGERSLTFRAGELGSQSKVHISINSPTKGLISKDFIFLPSTVNMLWEADTTVPPWYLGKALYSAGSPLTILALPQVVLHGTTVSANNLSFQWKRNKTPLPQDSGKGRNKISFDGNQLFSGETVSVDVEISGVVVAHGEIVVPASQPQILLYERDPLRGTLYDSALQGSITLKSTEATVRAEPFFFAKSIVEGGSTPYVWTLNGKDTTGPETAQGALTLRQTGSGAGSALLQVSLQNTDNDKLVQSAQTALRILFGVQSGSNASSFFGI